jgi:hypothetical protein
MRTERCSTPQETMVTQKRDHATRRDTLNTYVAAATVAQVRGVAHGWTSQPCHARG